MATVLDRSAYIHMVSPQPAMTREGCDADSQEIRIVAATARDSDYVIDAFKAALSPFYGGDHVAHARRVLETHLSGGWDRRGLLSNQQLLLILWQDGARLGILNLVFKRQETCKI